VLDVGLLPHQLEFMERDQEKRLALVTGVGCGKTMIAAMWLIQQAADYQNSIVSAQNYSALHKVVFAEIQRQARRFGMAFDYNKQDKTIVFPQTGATIFGASSEAPDSVLGLTNISNYLADESAYSCEALRNNCEERCRGQDLKGRIIKARYRYTTTPSSLPTSLWFRDMIKRQPGMVIHATTYDNYLVGEDFVKDQIEKYGGPDSPYVRQQIYGEFLEGMASNLAVNVNDFASERPAHRPDDPVWVGADIAAGGRDSSVFAVIDDYGLVEWMEFFHAETQKLVSTMLEINRKYKVEGALVDSTGGFGNGLVDYTKSTVGTVGVNFSEKADDDNMFNVRTQMYMDLGKSAKESHFYLPDVGDSMRCRNQLSYTTYILNGRGQVQLIPKEEIKKVTGSSPDHGDALVLANRARKIASGEVKGRIIDPKSVAARMLAAARR
jgi:hypothetical protein